MKEITFFIGNGFTKAIAQTAPTGTEFFSKAFDLHDEFIQDERIQKVKEFIDDIYYQTAQNKYPNIEDVLSLIDYVIQNKDSLSRSYFFEDVVEIKNNLIYLISKVIKDTISKSEVTKTKPSRDFVEKIYALSKNNCHISIISTNYDIILDNSLLEKGRSCNYEIRLRSSIYLDPRHEKTVKVQGKPSWEYQRLTNGTINQGEIALLKIHGSLNWFYCPKCQEIDIAIPSNETKELLADQSRFICENIYCTSNYEPLIVTPTMLKVYDNPFLQKLWTESENKISNADQLVFIGYSLPEADYHIRSLLIKGLAKNNKNPKIVVIDKKMKNEEDATSIKKVEERYMTLFGTDRIAFRPIGLESFLQTWDEFFDF